MNLMTTFTARKSIGEFNSFTIQEVFDVLSNKFLGYSLFDKDNREELDVIFETEDEAITHINELLMEKEFI